ncbi:PQ-loop repeat-containing protein 3 [Bombyx mandarina]|uniref:PQ-loop repeat-containing protein 3 n=2 Tax=Bombyx TaxID=7090 RepID=A0A8R2DPN9_BOMMO|nr:solute carrier family 66 member 3 [Bombyx mori]XP_021207983.2 solute carrier family 66 member 3 [Bombyx mori]XP_028034705.1 PQ-loop repeat-containing protein 3 [Bombyx mandarina]XP_028034714.1 PQ-loop repeat-containing protein 3 [Bombyx mandarina]XP_028034722.1 PQ-loop repeat-containing protein 3 [Bombyx mandarina]XP_037868313.1 solute carrier family 66 member 3 [Bombyx mori]XP_037868317.1 solute carrier family 66 member 3 [Bombyx mori]XP_037868319.1 solute carrier family 66 member 3 [Bom
MIDVPYLIEIFANALSTMTILSSLFLKVPQIMSIREKRSAEGIYIQAMLMEIIGFTIMSLYNYTNKYNIMTYMEYPIILFQVYVMFYFVLKYKNMLNLPIIPVMVASYFASVFGFVMDLLPKQVLSYLVPFCTPLSGFAKVTYIYGIIKSGNADAVSLTTWIISVLTNLARVFTVYVDSGDGKLLANFIISTLLSSGVFFTALHYQQQTACCPIHRPQKNRNRPFHQEYRPRHVHQD